LQSQVTATKLALNKIKRKQMARTAVKTRLTRLNDLTRPVLLMAGLSAVFTARLFFISPGIPESAAITEVDLSAYRNSEGAVLPRGRPLRVTLDAVDLPHTPILVEVVNPFGSEIWRGDAAVLHDKAEIFMPPFTKGGAYLLRLYAPAGREKKGEILREYAFHVK
jgi:hypothetical protein